MKHRILLLFSCLLCLVGITKAQDLEPGQQAQGYLDSKNVTVDHTTGIFHYKVPLYTLGTGDFQLPISLDYSALGVKTEDKPGLIGFNWLLNTGGVVTRTIRGGIADETSYCGYLWAQMENNALPLVDDVANVNKRKRDGECDIFTAVFNGQSVNFIVKMDKNFRIYAEPLECTNVRIECESATGCEIDGWIIIDQNGNRYIYRQKEWSVNIVKEDAISFNGIRDRSYVSSWYLSQIEPCNGETISFNYIEDVRLGTESENINITKHVISNKSRYYYGVPMKERTFDFSKYKLQFDQQIYSALGYLGSFTLEMQLNNTLHEYTRQGQWVINPNFALGLEAVKQNYRIMGILADFTKISVASNELIEILNTLINQYSNSSSDKVKMAVTCFRNAKIYVKQSLEEVNRNVFSKEIFNGTAYDVCSPVLQSITCAGKTIEFVYNQYSSFKNLLNINFLDVFNREISRVVLDGGKYLNSLIFEDKNRSEICRMKFDYYMNTSNVELMSDLWGYPKRKQDTKDEEYSAYVDEEYSKLGSLKTITTPNGGEIIIDYKPNFIVGGFKFGGICIKSLLMKDESNSIYDTIYYRYPMPGIHAFEDCSNLETVSYHDFSDNILHSRVKYSNFPFLKVGNNGIYYPYVQEIVCGKGMVAYLFNTDNLSERSPSFFWLTGLPLGKAIYDNTGNLKRLTTYKYLSDLSGTSNTGNYFIEIDTTVNYKYKMLQVKAYEYFMDEEFLETYYRNQGNVLLYEDAGNACYLNSYSEVYVPNIKPRTRVQLPRQFYDIIYGGKTLLREETEYRFETHVTDSAAYSDFSLKATGIPYQRIEYFYDNVNISSNPTRIVKIDSKGDSYTTVIKRVTEMSDSASPIIGKMKQRNMLTPIVKELQLKGDMVQVEKVTCYSALETNGVCNIVPNEHYIYYSTENESLPISTLTTLDVSLFTYGQPNYRLEKIIEYEQKNHSCLPVKLLTNTEIFTLYNDFNYNQIVLKAKNVEPKALFAFDFNKPEETELKREKIRSMMDTYNVFTRFNDIYQGIDVAQQSQKYQEYRIWDLGHRMMIDLISVVVSKKSIPFKEYCVLVDSVRANNGRHVNDFYNNYNELALSMTHIEDFRDVLSTLKQIINHPIVLDTNFFKYKHFIGLDNYLIFPDTINLNVIPESKRLKLFVLTNRVGHVYYSVKHEGGIAEEEILLPKTSNYVVHVFDLDLNLYKNASSVTVYTSSKYMAYIALVPDNTSFEAISYNLDGSVFCKFDQNGQLELYEYDAGGRLIRVKRRDGSLLKENRYNTLKSN